MVKKKVVLYFPKVFSSTRPWHGVPLALLATSREIVKQNYTVKIIADYLFEDYLNKIVAECKDSLCLGITCMTGFQITDGLKIASLIRQKYPKLPIVWGGWHPSILASQTAKDKRVDIVVRGQGERTFSELVNCLYQKKSLKNVLGITYKTPSGKIITNPDRPIEDINNFGPYPYHLIDIEKSLDVTEYGQKTIQYISSYGCPHRCGFCTEPIVNQRRWSGLSAYRVVKDWENLYKKYHIDAIAVYDSNFFVNKERVYKICLGLLKRKVKIKWGNANGRISQLIKYEPKIWRTMEKSGCQMILTGAESGSQEILDFIHKDSEVEMVKPFAKLCKKYHMRIFYSYLIGLPTTKQAKNSYKFIEDQFKYTLRQIDEMLDETQGNRFSISIYTPYPGSDLYQLALKSGFKAPKSFSGWSNFMAVPEDAFGQDNTRRWITRSQELQIAMLTQYIFGLMDIPTRDRISQKIPNTISRFIFTSSWNFGLNIARFRWKNKFFAFPIDFWVFTQIKKYLKLF